MGILLRVLELFRAQDALEIAQHLRELLVQELRHDHDIYNHYDQKLYFVFLFSVTYRSITKPCATPGIMSGC